MSDGARDLLERNRELRMVNAQEAAARIEHKAAEALQLLSEGRAALAQHHADGLPQAVATLRESLIEILAVDEAMAIIKETEERQ